MKISLNSWSSEAVPCWGYAREEKKGVIQVRPLQGVIAPHADHGGISPLSIRCGALQWGNGGRTGGSESKALEAASFYDQLVGLMLAPPDTDETVAHSMPPIYRPFFIDFDGRKYYL
jgi:hypothetical protein